MKLSLKGNKRQALFGGHLSKLSKIQRSKPLFHVKRTKKGRFCYYLDLT